MDESTQKAEKGVERHLQEVSKSNSEGDLKQIIAESRRQRRLYETIISNTPDLVYVFDLDYRFIFVNDALLKMWGRTEEESLGKSLQEVGYEAWHAEMHEREIDQVIATKTPVRGDVPFQHAELGVRMYDYILVPVLNREGEVEAVAGTTRDVTEKVEAQKEVRKMNETLEARVEERTAALLSYQEQLRSLASELSRAEEYERQRLATELHDNLGQLLTASKMKIDVLQRRIGENGEAEVSDLSELVDEAIRFTRQLMSELKPPPTMEDGDAGAVVEWVAERMQRYDLEVTVENDDQPKPLREEIRITFLQCIRELLFNVYKHSGVREARVSLSRSGDRIGVVVKDDGEGFQVKGGDAAPTEEGGFGLFNIRERLDLLGGEVSIESEPGKGTCVILELPVKDGQTEVVPVGIKEKSIRPPESVREFEKEDVVRVLLVDDHQIMREGLRKLIEEEGDLTVVAEASDGEEGVKLARETSPDVIVMDINLPVLNGFDATRKIASEYPEVCIVGLSLHEDRHVQQTMIEAGASACLAKADVFETLCATIRSESRMAGK